MITNLSKAFAGAVGVGAYVLLTTSVWKVADSLDWLRLTVAAALAIAAMVVWLIIDHHMWEQPADHPGRALAVLYKTTDAPLGHAAGALRRAAIAGGQDPPPSGVDAMVVAGADERAANDELLLVTSDADDFELLGSLAAHSDRLSVLGL